MQQMYAPLTVEDIGNIDTGALAASLVMITGDWRWVASPYTSLHYEQRLGDVANKSVAVDFVREANAAIARWRRDGEVRIPEPTSVTLQYLMGLVLGSSFEVSHVQHLREFLEHGGHHVREKSAAWPRVTIIGAGMSGIAMALELDRRGLPYTILDKNDDLGGVWTNNRYPDCGLDTQPYLYSWSSVPPQAWERFDAKQSEILDYMLDVARETGVSRRIRFGTEVLGATFDEDSRQWRVTAKGHASVMTFNTDVLISAVGSLSQPKRPDIPGLSDFEGKVFHTAEWPDDLSLAGKRAAIIGNGSSGVQVADAVAKEVQHLTIFQRSPHWIAPRPTWTTGVVRPAQHWLMDNLPFYSAWYRYRVIRKVSRVWFGVWGRTERSGLGARASVGFGG